MNICWRTSWEFGSISEISKKLSAFQWNMNICWKSLDNLVVSQRYPRSYRPFNGTWILVGERLENLVVSQRYPRNYPPFSGTWILVGELLENLVVSQKCPRNYPPFNRTWILVGELENVQWNNPAFSNIWNSTIHHIVPKSPPLPSVVNQMNSVHISHWQTKLITQILERISWCVRLSERDAVHFGR